jgi:hypothetical protein
MSYMSKDPFFFQNLIICISFSIVVSEKKMLCISNLTSISEVCHYIP